MSDSLELSISVGEASFSASGPTPTVLEAFGEFREMLAEAPSTTPSASKRAGRSASAKVPLAIFAKYSWTNQAAIATAIINWAKRFEDKPALGPAEMEKLWKKSGLKKPGNATQVCINAEKKGWIEKDSSGKYAVIGHGEEMVDKVAAAS